MLQYLGLFNVLFIIGGLVWLAGRDKNYSLSKKPISAIADNKQNKIWLILLICIFSLLQFIFAEIVLRRLNLEHAALLTAFLLLGVATLIASAITVQSYIILHRRLVQLGVALIVTGVMLLALGILRKNQFAGIIIIIATPILLIIQHILRNIRKVGYWELPLLLMVLVWNLTVTFLLQR